MNRNVIRPLWLLWGGLGGYRGHQMYNDDIKKNNENKYEHSYITNTGSIIIYSLIYIVPPFSFIGFVNELYNLEYYIKNESKKE